MINSPAANLTLEDLVREAKSSFLSRSVSLTLTALIKWQPWLGYPIVRRIVEAALTIVFHLLIDKTEFAAFLINTNFLTSQQAKSYREAVAKVLLIAGDSPEWEEAERRANAEFERLIRFDS